MGLVILVNKPLQDQMIKNCQYCRSDLGSEQTGAKLIDGQLGHALSLDVHPPSLAVLVVTPLEALQALVEVTGNGVQRNVTEVTAQADGARWYRHCKLGTWCRPSHSCLCCWLWSCSVYNFQHVNTSKRESKTSSEQQYWEQESQRQ